MLFRSVSDAYDRVSDFLDTLHRDFQKDDFPQNAILVAHGMLNRVFLMRWFHMSVEDFELLANPMNGEFYILQLQPNGRYELAKLPRKYDKLSHEFQYPGNFPGEIVGETTSGTENKPGRFNEPTTADVYDACMSYRHDFGLMSDEERVKLAFEAKEWLRAWRHAVKEL